MRCLKIGKEPVRAGFQKGGNSDLGSQRLVKLLPMFQRGWELQSAFKRPEAHLFRMSGAEN